MEVDQELVQLVEAVTCHRSICAHPYPEHADAGGPCRHVVNDRFPCTCPGFRWVDPNGPAVGSYTDPPTV